MFKQNVLEPIAVKQQIISSATEAACMIMTVNDIIAVNKTLSPSITWHSISVPIQTESH
jgi:chaperonin GroEL (HSP60 family)